jgi:hypothetical protein
MPLLTIFIGANHLLTIITLHNVVRTHSPSTNNTTTECLSACEAYRAVFDTVLAVLCAPADFNSATVSIPRITDNVVTAIAAHQAVSHASTKPAVCASKDAITAKRSVALLVHLADAPVVLKALTLLTLKSILEIVILCRGEHVFPADDAAV